MLLNLSEFNIQPKYFLSQTTNQTDLSKTVQLEQKEARLEFVNGLIRLSLELPARKEKCEFTLKLLNENVGNLIEYIASEDKSVEKVIVYNSDGTRLSKNTPISVLVTQPFSIRINEWSFKVEPPTFLLKRDSLEPAELQARKEIEDIKQLVSKLYLQLNVEHYEIEQEQKLLKKLELLKTEIAPMERVKEDLALKAKKHTNRMVWFGLVAMSVQAGVMARLTWFDYSWDIVEPISYFVTYAAVVGVYAYFVLTRKEYDYESASDRIFLRHFHKNAVKNSMDVQRYNEIKDAMYALQSDLKKIQESRVKKYQESGF